MSEPQETWTDTNTIECAWCSVDFDVDAVAFDLTNQTETTCPICNRAIILTPEITFTCTPLTSPQGERVAPPDRPHSDGVDCGDPSPSSQSKDLRRDEDGRGQQPTTEG